MTRLTVISLGGGVQSPVMPLMANQSLPSTGSGGPSTVPRTAPSSPTPIGSRQASTPTWNGSKANCAALPHVVDNGRSLREDVVKASANHSGSGNYVDIPVYLKGSDGQGIGRRQRTDNYKIKPIRRKMRESLGLRRSQQVPTGSSAELWLSISTDEAIGVKDSRDWWIENRYPLIEVGMSRRDCADWWEARRAPCRGGPCRWGIV